MTTQHRPDDALEQFAELLRDEQEPPGRGGRGPIDREAQHARRYRGLGMVALVMLLIFGSGGGYVAWALNAALPEPVLSAQAPPAPTPPPATITLPPEGASAIAVSGAEDYLGATAGEMWATTGTDDPRPMASITKLITALVVLDAHPLADAADPGPTLTFDRADHALYDKYYVMGATIAAMRTGSSMSLRDAIATMLIPSASNYAEAVATWAFGSQGGFIDAARRWLDANGLAHTTIVEPTGIDARNTSTPSDLIALGRLATAHPAVAEIVATRSLTVPGPGAMWNTNSLLGDRRVDGLKTGTLQPSGSNLLYTATLDVGTGEPLRAVGVVLGGSSRDAVDRAVTGLLDSIEAGFGEVTLAEARQPVGSVTTPWGGEAQLVIGTRASVLTWSDAPITVTMETTEPSRWIDGEEVGTITWTAGPNTVTEPIEIEGTIEPPTSWWRLTNPGELG